MNFFTLFGKYLMMLKGMFTATENKQMFWKEYIRQCVDIGIGSLPIVVIISFFLGAVTTVQTASQLVSPLVPLSTIGIIVRDSIIASELGNMRVSEQIDALEIMGINTKNYLILPKILGAITTVPLLVGISAVTGIWGGYIVGSWSNVVPAEVFITGIRKDFVVRYINISFYKSFIFAIIISTVPSFYGYYVKGGALEIGKTGTKSVVVSCILILIADYIIAAIAL